VKKKLMIVLPALVIALLAAKTLGLGGAAKPAASAEGATGGEVTTTTAAPGPVVALDSITLNTADGHYLKLGLAIEEAAGLASAGEHSGDDPRATWARALDLAIEVMGGRTYPVLVTPGGRHDAKQELEERLIAAYHEEVAGVYFTEFVLQ
jgi:flagellar FliL protein